MRLEHERSHNLILINLVRSLPGTNETVFTASGLLLAEFGRSMSARFRRVQTAAIRTASNPAIVLGKVFFLLSAFQRFALRRHA
jgi:hypothetical protein